ncbi:MAG TPA: DUF4342 domain-containing protein [Dehalococcoidia bacterium]|nr:DUF4342 domain-containing protein [Dehalococcoidia bacterium]
MTLRRETFRARGDELVERVRRLIHEGNVRRIILKHDGHILMEVPVTIGVAAIIVAPVLAAIGAIAVAAGEVTVEVERSDDGASSPPP